VITVNDNNEYFIDGKPATKAEVADKVREEYHIEMARREDELGKHNENLVE
jgi:hypothetical protein